jgi:protein SCO1/2
VSSASPADWRRVVADRTSTGQKARGQFRCRTPNQAFCRVFLFVWPLIAFFGPAATGDARAAITNYQARGFIKELKSDGLTVVIQHEAISNYMGAMSMPFKVKESGDLSGLAVGDPVTFRLRITDVESWIDHIAKTPGLSPEVKTPPGIVRAEERTSADTVAATATPLQVTGDHGAMSSLPAHRRHPMLDYKFTNELGQAVSIGDFRGQALALTFFFTRCPIPEFCPRLSRNFQDVASKLAAMPNAPTNWHLISITFDPMNDTPEVLKNYAENYHYDPKHWTFLTGPTNKIAELAGLCDVQYSAEGGLLNHNFRTLIIDAQNHLQMVFPTSGDLSDSIVQELLKAAAVTEQTASKRQEVSAHN